MREIWNKPNMNNDLVIVSFVIIYLLSKILKTSLTQRSEDQDFKEKNLNNFICNRSRFDNLTIKQGKLLIFFIFKFKFLNKVFIKNS